MDEPCSYHTFQRLMADEDKWTQVRNPASERYAKHQGMMIELVCFTEKLRGLRQLIAIMEKSCLEPLKRRNSGAYAAAYSYFYTQMLSAGAQVFGDEFEQSIPMEG